MIPVLIVPVVSRFDLLEQMVASIDHRIGSLVIVDNSVSGYSLPSCPPSVDSVQYLRPLIGLGYPGGINAGISQTPDAPWWMWASKDVTWGPGDLANIAALAESARGPRMVTGSDRRLRNVYGAANLACFEAVGLFDEWTFFPIYFDDDDMEYRCRQGGVEWVTYDGQIAHAGSATINSSIEAARANSLTFQENARRYVAKWGGPPGSERFSRPWDKPVPLSYAPVDIAGRARRMW